MMDITTDLFWSESDSQIVSAQDRHEDIIVNISSWRLCAETICLLSYSPFVGPLSEDRKPNVIMLL